MRNATRNNLRRRGVALVYVTVGMVGFLAMTSLAIDVSHVRLVKIELQGAADAAAQAAGSQLSQGSSSADTYAAAAAATNNADGSAVTIASSTDVVFGTWNVSTNTFTPMSGWSSSANAVQVYTRRTAATSNPVHTLFGGVIGISTVDVVASAVAYVVPATSVTVTINGTDDPWLAGMPAGSTASYDDTAPAESPIQVSSIPVVPGTYITLSNVSGGVRHDPSQATADGPDGESNDCIWHGSDSPGGPTPGAENGIGDVCAPLDAVMGLFLSNTQPNLNSAPAAVDYSTAASRDEAVYNTIQLQQPFYIGNGQTSEGDTQQFYVPAGATRLYLGTYDGHQWENNSGSFTATVNVPASVQIVQ